MPEYEYKVTYDLNASKVYGRAGAEQWVHCERVFSVDAASALIEVVRTASQQPHTRNIRLWRRSVEWDDITPEVERT